MRTFFSSSSPSALALAGAAAGAIGLWVCVGAASHVRTYLRNDNDDTCSTHRQHTNTDADTATQRGGKETSQCRQV